MVNFLFKKGQHVKVKATGEIGTVESCSTTWTTDTHFYAVRFDDGRTGQIAEQDLLPAS